MISFASAGVLIPHIFEKVIHVERQVVQLVLVAGNGAVHIVVKLGELIYVIPNGTSDVWKIGHRTYAR